jgi:hypothetical protein
LVFQSQIQRRKIRRCRVLLRDRFTNRVSPHISESSFISFAVKTRGC